MTSHIFGSKSFALLVLIVASLFLGLFRLGALPLIDSDEATYARVFHESVQRGDFLSLTKRGEPWLEKPPLHFWMMALSSTVFGENEFGLRLPAALLMLAAIILTYLITLRLVNDWKSAAFSAAILLTVGAFLDAGRQIRMDVPVTACILFSIYCFILAMEEPRWFLGFAAGVALGVLAKSVIGFFPIPIALIFAAVYKKWDWLKSGWLWLGAAVFLIIALPWHIYEYAKFGNEFLRTYWGYHIFQRFSEPILGGSNDNLFYLKNIFTQTQPWILAFAVAVFIFIFKYRKSIFKQKTELFVFISAIFVAAVFLIAKTKLFYYLVPAYPFMAIFIALIFTPLIQFKKYLLIFAVLLISGIGATALQIFYPITFDSLTFPNGVVSKYSLAVDEKNIAQLVENSRLPIYLYNWPYRDTLSYYGNAPEFFVVKNTEIPPAPSFLLMPTVFANPNFQDTQNLQLIYSGKTGSLFKVK